MESVLRAIEHPVLWAVILLASSIVFSIIEHRRQKKVDQAAVTLAIVCFALPFVLSIYSWTQASTTADQVQRVFTSIPPGEPQYAAFAVKALQDLRRQYDAVQAGIVTVQGNVASLDLYIRFLQSANRSENELLATSLVNPNLVWTNQLRLANRAFVEGGGRITRLFVYNNDAEKQDMLREAQVQQMDNSGLGGSLRTMVCDKSRLRSQETITDFIISPKDGLAIEFALDPADNDVAVARLTRDAKRIEELTRMFHWLRDRHSCEVAAPTTKISR